MTLFHSAPRVIKRYVYDLFWLAGLAQLVRRPPTLGRHRWVKTPPSFRDRKVCVLATYLRSGTLSPHTLHLAKQWKVAGYSVVLVATTDDTDLAFASDADFLDGVLVRSNIGYDFGSWATLIRTREDVHGAELLVLTNDSVYGPFNTFAAMLERVETIDATMVAATDSLERIRHVQSYLVFYKRPLVRSRGFKVFWQFAHGSGREEVIDNGELQQQSWFERRRVRIGILFPTPENFFGNPTLTLWRELIGRGFPFVKVQLLRDNPFAADLTGWPDILRAGGYEPALVAEHLAEIYGRSAAIQALHAAPETASATTRLAPSESHS